MGHAVVISSNKSGRTTVDICRISDWGGFDKLIEFLKQQYNAVIVESYNGPDARRSVLIIQGEVCELTYDDPYGNDLISMTPSGDELVRKIGLDLKQRLQ